MPEEPVPGDAAGKSVRDAIRDKRDAARAFCEAHLAECCAEILEWRSKGTLCNGRLREAAHHFDFVDMANALTMAEDYVGQAAMKRVVAAELLPDRFALSEAATSLLTALKADHGQSEVAIALGSQLEALRRALGLQPMSVEYLDPEIRDEVAREFIPRR